MIINADCIDAMRDMPDNSVDAVVTDPPYGLSKQPDTAEVLRHWLAGDDYVHKGGGFMGKSWDSFVPGPSVWKEVFRVLKPGGHVLCFAGTRTQDLMAMSLRLAGFEIRDMIAWTYGSGFPKSHDVSKAIDKSVGAVRDKIGDVTDRRGDGTVYDIRHSGNLTSNDPITAAAAAWAGWGTALKPALEPITVARKPLVGTVAANVLEHRTGAINIDGCRVGDGSETGGEKPEYNPNHANAVYGAGMGGVAWSNTQGRHPANLIHDGSPEINDVLGSAARFFYCTKASKADRNDRLGDFPVRATAASEFRPNHTVRAQAGDDGNPCGRWTPTKNHHPTVKPTDLMRYLCRLVTPPGGTVLDPFTGSGSTGRGAVLENFKFIGIELDPEYVEIANARIKAAEVTAFINKMKGGAK